MFAVIEGLGMRLACGSTHSKKPHSQALIFWRLHCELVLATLKLSQALAGADYASPIMVWAPKVPPVSQ